MTGLARDDVGTLRRRTEGQSLVCAMLVEMSPPTIRDKSDVMVIPPMPAGTTVLQGDVCLFLFDCTPRPPVCKRVTVVHPSLVPLYIMQLEQYREYVAKKISARNPAPAVSSSVPTDSNNVDAVVD